MQATAIVILIVIVVGFVLWTNGVRNTVDEISGCILNLVSGVLFFATIAAMLVGFGLLIATAIGAVATPNSILFGLGFLGVSVLLAWLSSKMKND